MVASPWRWALLTLVWPVAAAWGVPLNDLEGTWVGSAAVAGNDEFVLLRLQKEGSEFKANISCPRLLVRATPATEILAEADRLALSFRTPDGILRLDCAPQGLELAGTCEYKGATGTCKFRRYFKIEPSTCDEYVGNYRLGSDRVLFVGRPDARNQPFLIDGDLATELIPVGKDEFVDTQRRTFHFERDKAGKVVLVDVANPGQAPVRAPRVQLYTQEPVSFNQGNVRLSGTLTLPVGPGPWPALVFVHGSGPGTRNNYIVEADLFARHGIACLGYDKRGCGQSQGDWHRADFDVLADDALAAVKFLHGDRRIRPDKIGLLGASQAAWIIPLAASRSADVAFIVPISGGAVSPAEQELWRQRQNLEYMGVPERFIELERKSAAMAYDWHRRHQLGAMPIPNPFAEDSLNMYHDAEAVMQKVHQPALVILGGLDRLTPPHESAALWAKALRDSGNNDYSVRLYPRGTHGLRQGGKTGFSSEVLPEARWAPGYFDTMVKWIHHHVDGPVFADARRVDVEPEPVPHESRGMQHLSWFGSGGVQPWLLLIFLAVFVSAVLSGPCLWVWQWWHPPTPGQQLAGANRLPVLGTTLAAINLAILAAMIYLLYYLVMAAPHPALSWLRSAWIGLAIATLLSAMLGVLFLKGCIDAWRLSWWSQGWRVYYTVVGVAVLAWLPFVFYWDLWRPI